MRYLSFLMVLVIAGLMLVGCTTAPPVADSREILWQSFGNHPVDELLMGWGAPDKETKLTDGSRLLTYQHSTIYDSGTSYERSTGCEATFLAKPSAFRIADIALQGSPNECRILSQGKTGAVRLQAAEPAYPYYGAGYAYRTPFRYGF